MPYFTLRLHYKIVDTSWSFRINGLMLSKSENRVLLKPGLERAFQPSRHIALKQRRFNVQTVGLVFHITLLLLKDWKKKTHLPCSHFWCDSCFRRNPLFRIYWNILDTTVQDCKINHPSQRYQYLWSATDKWIKGLKYMMNQSQE